MAGVAAPATAIVAQNAGCAEPGPVNLAFQNLNASGNLSRRALCAVGWAWFASAVIYGPFPQKFRLRQARHCRTIGEHVAPIGFRYQARLSTSGMQRCVDPVFDLCQCDDGRWSETGNVAFQGLACSHACRCGPSRSWIETALCKAQNFIVMACSMKACTPLVCSAGSMSFRNGLFASHPSKIAI